MTTPDFAERDRQAAEDRAEAADKWRRGYFQLRGSFVQDPTRGGDRKGPLATFVKERQHRALLLYLMLISVWPWLHDDKLPLEAHVWMNLLHSRKVGAGRSIVWSESTLSRTWKYLEQIGLVKKRRGRKGRLRVRPRIEDGSGRKYQFPSGEKANWHEVYFTIPDRFWLQEEFARLNLPGLAMLLIFAKETNKKSELRITQEQVAEWYGISRSTVVKGLAELRAADLLEERTEWIPAKLSKIRTTSATYYSLRGDYSTAARKRARANAERRRKRSLRSGTGGAGPKFAASTGEGGEENGAP